MFNPFLMLYGIVLLGFLLSVLAITYHLIKYQLNRRVTLITLVLFLSGAALLLVISLVMASQINWSQYSIIF